MSCTNITTCFRIGTDYKDRIITPTDGLGGLSDFRYEIKNQLGGLVKNLTVGAGLEIVGDKIVIQGDALEDLPVGKYDVVFWLDINGQTRDLFSEDLEISADKCDCQNLYTLAFTIIPVDISETVTEIRLNFDDLTPEQKLALTGPKGDKPAHEWNGTSLSFENPDGSMGESVNLKGQKGDKGETGDPFTIYKSYPSIVAMESDFANVPDGSFVAISSNEEDPDNAKLFLRGTDEFTFITDLSGAQGIKGDKGDRGEGYLGIITPSTTIPSTGSWYGTVLEAGTFSNVTPAITVTTADFDVQNGTPNNEVRIIISDGVATKDVRRVKGDKGDDGLGNVTLKSPSYDALPDKSLLIDEGTFITSKSANATYPNAGVISSTTGAYTAQAGRMATDFIDVTGYTHILQNALVINSAIGTAFYDASNVFISGAVNTGSPQLLAIPAGTKYVRTSGYSPEATAYLYLVNILKTEANTLSFWRGGVLTEMKITPEALQFARLAEARDHVVAFKEGDYLLTETVHPKPATAQYVQYGSGATVNSASYRRNDKTLVGFDTHLLITGLTTETTSNNVTFYNSGGVYMGYLLGKSANASVTDSYAIPTGAHYWQVSTLNSNIATFLVKAQRRQTVEENQLMFYENDEVIIYEGGSGSVPISGAELIADLPVSDGTAQASGDAYIDSATRTVKVKA